MSIKPHDYQRFVYFLLVQRIYYANRSSNRFLSAASAVLLLPSCVHPTKLLSTIKLWSPLIFFWTKHVREMKILFWINPMWHQGNISERFLKVLTICFSLWCVPGSLAITIQLNVHDLILQPVSLEREKVKPHKWFTVSSLSVNV